MFGNILAARVFRKTRVIAAAIALQVVLVLIYRFAIYLNEPRSLPLRSRLSQAADSINFSLFQQFLETKTMSPYFHGFDLTSSKTLSLVSDEAELIPKADRLLTAITETELLGINVTLHTIADILRYPQEFATVMLVPRAEMLKQAYSNRSVPHVFGEDACPKYVKSMTINPRKFKKSEGYWSGYETPQFSVAELVAYCHGSNSSDPALRYAKRPVSNLLHDTFIAPVLVATKNAAITELGNVHRGKFSVQQAGYCWNIAQRGNDYKLEEASSKYYDKVFVINQNWGWAVYHNLIEDSPRIALYFEYLLKHPDIKIHVSDMRLASQVLKFLGFDADRLISGSIHAGIVYLPAPTVFCGVPNVFNLLKLREMIHRRLETNATIKPVSQKKKIVVIKRTSGRYMFNHDAMVSALVESLGSRFEIEIFGDSPTPDFPTSMKMFYDASVVVAPHGAGLANTVACKKGTVIIEHFGSGPNFCYSTQTSMLGLDHFSTISAPRANAEEIMGSVQDTIEIIKKFVH